MARARDHYRGPEPDGPAQQAVEGAVVALAQARDYPLSWASSELAVLASLDAVVAARLAAAVARCREEGLSWTEVGDLLGVARQSARARFSSAGGSGDVAGGRSGGPR